MPSKIRCFLFCSLLWRGLALGADQQCTVSGHITNASTGEPLKKATLHLTPISGSGHQGYFTVSGSDGGFQFSNIEPGSYQLMGDHAGFLYTAYGAKKQGSPGTILALKPGQQMTDVALALTPAGIITGRVLDEDGDPTANASIQLSRRMLVNGKITYQPQGGANSDDRGEFRFSGLEPGKYIILAQLNRPAGNNEIANNVQNTGPVLSYYPSSLSAEDAVPVQVQSGQELTGIELRMRSAPMFHVRGTISPPGAAGQFSLMAVPEGSNGFDGNTESIDSAGKFDVSNIVPGSYRLILFENGSTFLGSQTVRVESADVDGIVINVVQPGSISGRASVEGTPPAGAPAWSAKSVHVALNVSNVLQGPMFGGTGEFSIDSDGNFVVKNVSACTYEVTAWDGRDETYLKAVRFNGQDVLNRQLDLSQGVSGQLEIVFSYGASQVHGTVQPADNTSGQLTIPLGGSVLMLDSQSGRVVNSDRIDQNGSFSFTGLAPGTYRLYAFDELGYSVGNVPELLKALENKSTEVELKENNNKQVQLTLISDDELQQTMAKLGLDVQ